MRIRKARPSESRAQAEWIAGSEPWRSLGYRAAPLTRWLGGCARRGLVKVAVERSGGRDLVRGIIVVQPEVLLGRFIALLAVPEAAAGQGVGRALVADAALQTFRSARWLYTSADQGNRAARSFYRKLGFVQLARLPDLVRAGRNEILLRLARPKAAFGARSAR